MHKLLLTAVLIAASSPALAETIHIGVDGLVCAFCVKGIETSFKKQDAVDTVDVSLDDKLVTVTTKTGQTIDDELIKKTITDSGYNVTTIHRQK